MRLKNSVEKLARQTRRYTGWKTVGLVVASWLRVFVQGTRIRRRDDGEGQAGLWGIKKFLIATVSQRRRPRCKAVANYRLRNYGGVKEASLSDRWRF